MHEPRHSKACKSVSFAARRHEGSHRVPCCSQPVSDRAFAAAQLHSKRLVKLDTQYLGSSIISAGGFCLSSLRPYLLEAQRHRTRLTVSVSNVYGPV